MFSVYDGELLLPVKVLCEFACSAQCAGFPVVMFDASFCAPCVYAPVSVRKWLLDTEARVRECVMSSIDVKRQNQNAT